MTTQIDPAKAELVEESTQPCVTQVAINNYNNANGAIPATTPPVSTDVGRK